jgi:hypothetical protein
MALTVIRERVAVFGLVVLGFSWAAPAAPSSESEIEPWRIRPATGPIVLDGRIDEIAWQDALRVTLDVATWPVDNQPAPVETVVRLTYDDTNLYLGFRAIDPDPRQIRARYADHDQCWRDDLVGVALDTFNDGQRSLMFIANPLGAQYDAIRTNENGEQGSWDAIWHSVGSIDALGFSVEMAIPFSSLRFQRSESDQVWGVRLNRIYPRDQRLFIQATAVDRNNSCEACQYPKMVGFAGVTPGTSFELIPTVTALASESRDVELLKNVDAPVPEFQMTAREAELGLTMGWGVTNNMTLIGTINPDFSTVEADAPQVDINQPFAIFYPEKRPFFTEGIDFFNTPFDLVYTRNIRDPIWGAKLTGKEGANTVAAFVTSDELTNLIIPGVEGSDMVSLATPALASVVRYSRDFGRGSKVGAIATIREGDDYYNRVAGADANIRLTPRDTVTAQFIGSVTQYPEDVAADYGQSREAFDGTALELHYRHDTRSMEFCVGYDDIADGFRADLGFLPQVGYREAHTSGRYIWYPEGGWISRLWVGPSARVSRDQHGGRLRDRVDLSMFVEGGLQSQMQPLVASERVAYNGRDFDLVWAAFWGQMKPTTDLVVGLNFRIGDDVDYANTQPGERIRLQPSMRYFIGRHFQFAVAHTYERMVVAAGELYTANIARLSAIYQFTPRARFKAVIDGVDYRYNVANYGDGRDPVDRGLASQLLFSYRINPQTSLFVGYNDRYQGDHELGLTQSDRSVFLKVGYAWSL